MGEPALSRKASCSASIASLWSTISEIYSRRSLVSRVGEGAESVALWRRSPPFEEKDGTGSICEVE